MSELPTDRVLHLRFYARHPDRSQLQADLFKHVVHLVGPNLHIEIPGLNQVRHEHLRNICIMLAQNVAAPTWLAVQGQMDYNASVSKAMLDIILGLWVVNSAERLHLRGVGMVVEEDGLRHVAQHEYRLPQMEKLERVLTSARSYTKIVGFPGMRCAIERTECPP